MSVPAAIIAVIGFLPSIFKHKPFCLWYWNGTKWEMKGGPFSSRQCRKTITALVGVGMIREQFLILRKGVTPPDGFNPPTPKEAKP